MMELWRLAPSVGWFYLSVAALALMILIGGMVIFTRKHFRRKHELED
jgi:hypothetical protein